MKLFVPLAATVIVAALTLTGCSTGALPGGIPDNSASSSAGNGGSAGGATDGSGSSGEGATANGSTTTKTTTRTATKTFTGKSLVTILTEVAVQTGDTNEVFGNSDSRAAAKSDTSGADAQTITGQLTADGGTFSPASCAALVNSLGVNDENRILQSEWYGAALLVGPYRVSLGSAPTAADAASVSTDAESIVSQLASQCPSMSVANGSNSFDFTVSPVSAATNADKTYAYEEIVKYADGTTDITEAINAVYDNMFIDVITATQTTPDTSAMEADVNAVIAAAKG